MRARNNHLTHVFLLLTLAVPAWADIVITNSGDQTIYEGNKTSVTFTVKNNDTATVSFSYAASVIIVGPKDPSDWVHFTGLSGGQTDPLIYIICTKFDDPHGCNRLTRKFDLAPGDTHSFKLFLVTDASDLGPPRDTKNDVVFAAIFNLPNGSEDVGSSELSVFVSDAPEPTYLGSILVVVFFARYSVRRRFAGLRDSSNRGAF